MPTLIYRERNNIKATDRIQTQRTEHKVNRQNHGTQIRNRKKN